MHHVFVLIGVKKLKSLDKWYHKKCNYFYLSQQSKSCVKINCVQISHLEIQQSLVRGRGQNELKCFYFTQHGRLGA